MYLAPQAQSKMTDRVGFSIHLPARLNVLRGVFDEENCMVLLRSFTR
jgi:hypothetical protein